MNLLYDFNGFIRCKIQEYKQVKLTASPSLSQERYLTFGNICVSNPLEIIKPSSRGQFPSDILDVFEPLSYPQFLIK